MAYNYPPPGPFGNRQTPFGPPGMPFAGAPGMPTPPGMQPPHGMPATPTALPSHFQPPPNMPNINFNAPVIRLGLDNISSGSSAADRSNEGRGRDSGHQERTGNRGRSGIGADSGRSGNLERERAMLREDMASLQPPTREEVARTIFIGGLADGAPSDDQLQRILSTAGKLRRWTRAYDADDKKCKFGFAEYEDVESLEAAAEIFNDFEVPLFDPAGMLQKESDRAEGEYEKLKLLMVVDDASRKYIEEWTARKNEDATARQFRIDNCKEDATQTVAALANANAFAANALNGQDHSTDRDGDVAMGDGNGHLNGDGEGVVSIPVTQEDELSHLPPEKRERIREEIKIFRGHAEQREAIRVAREAEIEKEERLKADAAPRINRAAAPPSTRGPSGPASASNGIPIGPRGQSGVQGAPAGPRGYRGAQLPSDYANGVSFVSSTGARHREDEDAEESDEELERRRVAKENAYLDDRYEKSYHSWIERERHGIAARKRQKTADDLAEKDRDERREREREHLMTYEDKPSRSGDMYFRNPDAWNHERQIYRSKEKLRDDWDRQLEERDTAERQRREAEARGQADDFLNALGGAMEGAEPQRPSRVGFGGFKISRGAVQSSQRKPFVEVESLLADEEDAAADGLVRQGLRPLNDVEKAPANLPEDEKTQLRQELAKEIPVDTESLFAHEVKWNHLSESIYQDELKPFIERKVVEALGVQEELMVDTIYQGVHKHRTPQALVGELEAVLDDAAEQLIKTIWRMVVYFSEAGHRGLL